MAVKDNKVLYSVWRGILDSLLGGDEDAFNLIPKTAAQKVRSTSMARLREQLWRALDDATDEWAYPIDIFLDNNGRDLFAVVAQSGKLYSVPLSVKEDTLTLGDWTQVKEEFTPVAQSRNRFSVRRQKDGKYRWLSIAATTVLNRVGEIDSSELFDNFIKRADKSKKYPRLDFYHLGETNPKAWEFGTADYLAREGVCYIATGLFDEDHPLAKATIKACQDSDVWGNSIEFYAYSEPEIIIADPEVRIPVYKDGENIRISVVLEEDAAGLFTRIGVNEEVKRTMDDKTKEVLGKLFGEDTDGLSTFLESFEEGVDDTNKRVKNDKLIHRAKPKTEPEAEVDTEDPEDTEDEESDEDAEVVLDESLVVAFTQQMVQSDEFKAITQSLDDIKKLIAQVVVDREADVKRLAKFEKDLPKLAQSVSQLGKEDGEKKTEYLQDLPSRRQKTVTYRPREVHNEEEDADFMEDLEAVATRTLNGIPNTY